MIEKLKNAITQELLQDWEDRNDGGLHVSHLLYCPLKYEHEKTVSPNRTELALEILEGIRFEDWIRQVLHKAYGGNLVEPNTKFSHAYNRTEIIARPDVIIEKDDEVLLFEIKNTQFSYTTKPISGIYYDNSNSVYVPEHYVLQVAVYKNILSHHYEKNIRAFIVLLTNTRNGSKLRKSLIVKPIKDTLTDNDIAELVKKFHTDKAPRYSWECSYCPFNEVCQSPNKFNPNPIDFHSESNPSIDDLINAYLQIQAEKKALSEQESHILRILKGAISEPYETDDFWAGWETYTSYEFDLSKIPLQYLQVKYSKRDEIINKYPEAVKKIEKKIFKVKRKNK